MKKIIPIQKVDAYGNGRKDCLIDVELQLENGNFSACVDLWNNINTDIIEGGQCFDSLIKEYPELKDNQTFMEVYDLWSSYHLNDMHAGTPEQRKAVEEFELREKEYRYEKICDYLKSIDLYEVSISSIDTVANPSFIGKEGTYKYGSAWLKETIPEKDIARIECLIETGKVLEPDKEESPVINNDFDFER